MTRAAGSDLRVTDVDLGVCRGARFGIGADRWAILLPGARYSTTAPLLWFAREAALAAGRNVLAVLDSRDANSGDPHQWTDERAEAALHHVGDGARPILIAKSITSLATPIAARLGLPAIWLTPLLGEDSVVDGLTAATAPFLLIGGAADPSWDGARARSLRSAQVLEIADADHALQVPGDVDRSLDSLRSVSAAVAEFIGAIDGASVEPRLTGFDHVQLAIPRDGETQARDFYGTQLGLKEVAKPEPLASRDGAWFVGSGIHLHLGVADDFQPARKAHPAFRLRHLAVLRDRLTSSDIAVEDDDSLPGVRRFYAADPFGNRLEFIEDADGGFMEQMSGAGKRDVQQALRTDEVSVLVISGPGGVGKSTVAFELSLLLQRRNIGHAVVDTDGLDHVYPVPPDLPSLTERNLAAVWESYRERGVSRLILTGVYLDRPDELAWLERAIPGASFAFVRLIASADTVLARVARRELGSGAVDQGECSAQQLTAMGADRRPEVRVLEIGDRSVTEIAGRLLADSGWRSSR